MLGFQTFLATRLSTREDKPALRNLLVAATTIRSRLQQLALHDNRASPEAKRETGVTARGPPRFDTRDFRTRLPPGAAIRVPEASFYGPKDTAPITRWSTA